MARHDTVRLPAPDTQAQAIRRSQKPAVTPTLDRRTLDRRTLDRRTLDRRTLDLSSLNGLDVYQIGRETLVVHTTEGREVRITAKHDLRKGTYRAEYERRARLQNGGTTYSVWALTPAHEPFVNADPEICLQQALRNINKLHLF
jgi:hypothetical protein